jgi:hypothetical protein
MNISNHFRAGARIVDMSFQFQLSIGCKSIMRHPFSFKQISIGIPSDSQPVLLCCNHRLATYKELVIDI